MWNRQRIVLNLLKVATSLPLFYAGIVALLFPEDWVSFIPGALGGFIEPFLLLKLISVSQIILGTLIMWGRWLTLTASLAALFLFGVVATNYDVSEIFFRDLGLAFSAIALALLAKDR